MIRSASKRVSDYGRVSGFEPGLLNPNQARYQTSPTRYANLLYEIPGEKSTRKTQFFPHLRLHFRRPPCIGIELARKGGLTHGGERDKEEAGEPLSGGEAAAAAAAPLPGPVRGGVFGPGDGPGAGDGAFPAGGPAGSGGHGRPRGLCSNGCVVLPGRAGGGDISGLVGGCDALG